MKKCFILLSIGFLLNAMTLHAQPDSLWSRTFGGEERDYCRSLIQTTDGGFVLAGFTESFGAGRGNFWMIKTGPDPVSAPPEPFIPHPSSFILLEAYPNPFNAVLNLGFQVARRGEVKLEVMDITGRRVAGLFGGLVHPGEQRLIWNAAGIPAGGYWVRLTDAQGAWEIKAVSLVK